MSLRLRAVLIAGVALIVLWAVAAAWMMRGVHANLDHTLDQRLAMSARMVSGLLKRVSLSPQTPKAHWADIIRISSNNGIACEIRSMQGTVLAKTEGSPYSTTEALPLGYSTRDVDGQQWRIYVLQDDSGYQVMTADRMDKRDAIIESILRAAGIPFLIAVFGGLVALWIGIGRGLSPLETLRQTLREKRTDDTRPIQAGCTPTELLPVITALNGLLARLSQALASQRAFTDAAAHELRSPLTAIDTHLQVVRLTDGEQAQASLKQAEEGVRRLRHTLDQMMTLARTEAALPQGDACPSVCAVVDEAIARFGPALHARVARTVHGPDSSTPIPRSMLDTSVRNLVDNALRYSPDASLVEVDVHFDAATRQCCIAIADRGPGLSQAQAARIGQRFWRGDQGRRQGEGSGLGISIVRAIADRFGGTLILTARDGGGLLVELTIPLDGS